MMAFGLLAMAFGFWQWLWAMAYDGPGSYHRSENLILICIYMNG